VRREDEAMKGLLAILKAVYNNAEFELINSGTHEVPDYDGEYEVHLTKGNEEITLNKKQYEALYNFVSTNIPVYINLINTIDD